LIIGLAVSAATGLGMDRLLAALHRFAAEAIGSSDDGALVTHERHHAALVRVSDALSRALDLWYVAPVELVAEELRRAAADLGRVTGAIDNEAVLDAIFRRFCIGK
jgi:tRNA modification GTPase